MKQKGTKSPIKNEATNGLKNKNGSVAMARTNVVDSATAQFFINVKDNDFLDHRSTSADAFGYAVFGQVIEGMDVVQKIEKVKTRNSGMHQDVPVDPVPSIRSSWTRSVQILVRREDIPIAPSAISEFFTGILPVGQACACLIQATPQGRPTTTSRRLWGRIFSPQKVHRLWAAASPECPALPGAANPFHS